MKVSFVSVIAMVAILTSGIGIGFVLAQTAVPPVTAPFSIYLPALFAQTSHAAGVSQGDDTPIESVMLGASDVGFKAPYITIVGGTTASHLHLPQGAEVVQITVWYSMTQPVDYTTSVLLQKQQRSVYTNLANDVIAANQPTGEHELVVTVPAGTAIIDNHTYGYRIALQSNAKFIQPTATTPNAPLPIPPNPPMYDVTQIRVDYRLP